MFGEKERTLRILDQEPTTILDKGCQFEGKLTFEGSVQINGRFNGEIFSEGFLIIGEGAEVEGKIEVSDILIKGKVRGSICADQRIEMQSPAFVRGDIQAPALAIQEGVLFEGNCTMGKKIINDLEKIEESASEEAPAYEFISQE